MFWNTKKSANSTGIGSSIGQQPPNGLTLCSLYSLNISCCSRCGSSLYLSWISFISGWTACICMLARIAFWLSGQRSIRTRMPKQTSTSP